MFITCIWRDPYLPSVELASFLSVGLVGPGTGNVCSSLAFFIKPGCCVLNIPKSSFVDSGV